jgi:hypothetical protein
MLRVVRLVDQWREILRGLPEGWGKAHFRLTLDDPAKGGRAAAVLAPLNPARRGGVLNFYATRFESAALPELVRRYLQRLDKEGIRGRLELVDTVETARPPEVVKRLKLVEAWEAQVEALPPDWSDLYVEVELLSTDYLERAALLLAPLNPASAEDRPALRFRVARQFGYGGSPEMARRCLERLDEDGIRGDVRILHALSDTKPVATQGPVWYMGGRSV